MIQAVHEPIALCGKRDIVEIVRVNYDPVFRFCAHRVGVDLAEDVAQETFMTAHKALKRFRGDSSIRTWLFGIAHNECRRMLRKKRMTTSLEDIIEVGESPEGVLVDRQALRKALMELSQDHRDAVVAVELDGLSYDEASVVLGVPSGTVKSRIHYAFQHLRKALEVGGVAQ